MKKIVLVTGNTKGGIIQFLETLESVLREIGFEITVVAPAEIEEKLQNKKNYIYYKTIIEGSGFTRKINSLLFKKKAFAEIAKRVNTLKPDLIWLIDNPINTVEIGLKLVSTKIPMLLTLHDAGGNHPTNQTIYQQLRNRYTDFLSDKLEHKVNYILLLSKISYDKYGLLKPKNIGKRVYFCLGAHVPNVKELKPEEITENQFHLFFGRIDKYKGIETLFRAFSKVDNPEYKLVVAGSGELTKKEVEVYNQIKKDVTLINRYIRDEEMLWLFHHARSVVLPYIEATQSGVIPIAYKFGVPVIVSNVDGLTQFVDNEKTGFVCESEIDYITALNKLENDNTRSVMSEAAVEYHLSNMDWKKNIISVLDAILN